MATKTEIDEQVRRLREDMVSYGVLDETAQRFEAVFLPNQRWALVERSGDGPMDYGIWYFLGDTKGEAYDNLRTMRHAMSLLARFQTAMPEGVAEPVTA